MEIVTNLAIENEIINLNKVDTRHDQRPRVRLIYIGERHMSQLYNILAYNRLRLPNRIADCTLNWQS